MSPVDTLLERLDGVKARSSGQWYANCPAHEDKSPSLSVKESDGGTVLLHCFAGCGAAEVMQAIGLSLSDLFPEPPEPRSGRQRQRPKWNYRELLQLLNREATVCAKASMEVAMGHRLNYVDAQRVWQASERISKILEVTRARSY